jgi:hypothetical protein
VDAMPYTLGLFLWWFGTGGLTPLALRTSASHICWRFILTGLSRGGSNPGGPMGTTPYGVGSVDIKVASVGGLVGFWLGGG